MSKRSDKYYEECRQNCSGSYYKNYSKSIQPIAINFEKNYRDMEFFRKHIQKNTPFSEPEYLKNISDILNSKQGKEVYIIKADGHIQKARIDCVMAKHYRRKVFDLKKRECFTINHQLRKVLGIYDTKGNVLWEFLNWRSEDPKEINSNKVKIQELTELNR